MSPVIEFEKSEFIKNVWNKRAQIYHRPKSWNFNLEIDDVCSLALEEEAISRLIKFKDKNLQKFEYTKGPFKAEELSALPVNQPWSLMIQDLEDYYPELTVIKEELSFIPPVLREDIMSVICGPSGTTGPHVDRYGVFIVPVVGQKTWRLERKTVTEEEAETRQLESEDLKILKELNTGHEFTLDSSKFLYIPPGLAHHATSTGLSLSLSYGVKAPRLQIILDVLYTKMINEIHSDKRLGICLDDNNTSLNLNNIDDKNTVLKSLLAYHKIEDINEVLQESRDWEGY